MARAREGWVNTAKNDYIQEFWSSNVLKRTGHDKKVCSKVLFFKLNMRNSYILGATVTTSDYTL